MLVALSIIFTIYLMAKKRNIEISGEMLTDTKFLILLIIATTVAFWLFHIILSKDKNFDRYAVEWDEDGIRIVRVLTTICIVAVYILICISQKQEDSSVKCMKILMIVIAIFDIIQIFMIQHTYSDNIKCTIVDAFLMQIQNVRNALIAILAINCAIAFTTMGFIFLLVIISAIVVVLFK